MKHLLGSSPLLSLLACFIASAIAIAETGEHPAAAEKKLYETRLHEIEQEYADTVTNLATKYNQALEKAATDLQNKGDLDGLLAIKEELARYKSTGKVPDKSPADAPATIQNFQKIYREASSEAVSTRHVGVTKLTGAYQTHLEALQKNLTRQGKIEDAIQIKKEAESLSAFKEKVAAQGAAAGIKIEAPPAEPAAGDQSSLLVAWNGSRSKSLLAGNGRPTFDYKFTHEGGNSLGGDCIILKGGKTLINGLNKELLESCKKSNAFTLVIELQTDNLKQAGPARIFSYSFNGTNRNFSLCQENDELVLRLRTTKTGANGTNPQVKLGKISADSRHRIVIRYEPGKLACSIDGKPQKVQQIEGDFSNWEEHQLVLGNEWKDDRAWKGRIYEFALHSEAITTR